MPKKYHKELKLFFIICRQSFGSGKKNGVGDDDINGEGKFIGDARNDGKDAFLSRDDHR